MSDLPEVPNVTQPTPASATAGLPAGPATPTPDAAPSPTSTPSAMGGTPAPATAAPSQSGTPSSPAAASMGGTPSTDPSAASSGAPLKPPYTPQQARAMAMGGFMDATTAAMSPGHKAPGSIWRTILSAALVGAAAGSGHGWEGAGEGMKAATKLREDQQKRQQQQFENERQKQKDALEQTKEAREKTLAEATIANFHNEAINRTKESDLRDAKYHAEMNALNNSLIDGLRQKGGIDPTDPNVPSEIGAYQLRDLVTKHPEVLHPSDKNYTRIYIDTTDGSQHTFGDTNWKDKDGKDVDMTNHTKFRVMDIPLKDINTKIMTPNEAINSARGLEEGDTGALPAGGKTAWSMTDDMNARAQAAKVLNEKSESDFRIAQANFEMKKLELEAQKLSQMANTENEKAFRDSMDMSTRFRDNLKERLNDPLTPAADKDKLRAQIDSMDDLMMKAYKKAHKGMNLPAATGSPLPPPDTGTASGLLNTVKGYVPPPLQSIVGMYINGGTLNGNTIPKSETYSDFLTNLSRSQSSTPDSDRLTPKDHDAVIAAGKAYYDNLPKVKQSVQQDATARKLSVVKARNPGVPITEKDLDSYDDSGNFKMPTIASASER